MILTDDVIIIIITKSLTADRLLLRFIAIIKLLRSVQTHTHTHDLLLISNLATITNQ